MRLIVYLSLLGFVLILHSQNDPCTQTVSGSILDLDTGEPLPFATVKISNSDIGVITDTNGYFSLSGICKGEIDLEVRFIGYKTIIHHHDFHHPIPIIYLASDETMLESIVVEEELNAHELKTLARKEIELDKLESLGTNAGNLFSQSTGVGTLKTGQNIIKPIVHGLHSNRVLIVNNGVRHSYQAWGSEHGVEIDASQIERIQLIKGASTVRYGSDALGGVILFNAPQPSYLTKLNGEVNGGFQSNGISISGEVSLNEGYERSAWMATVSGTKQGDLSASDYQLTNTGKEEFGFTVASRFHLPLADIDIFISHFDQNLGILRGSVVGNLDELSRAIGDSIPFYTSDFSFEINNPRQETAHSIAKLKTSLFLGEQQFDIQYAFQRNIRGEFDIRRGGNNELPSIDLRLLTHTIDFDWDHPSSGAWAGTLGLQFFSQNNDNLPGTNTIPFVPNYNTTTLGFFGIESYKSGNTTYEAGIRFDIMNLNVRGRDSKNDIYRDNLNYENFTFTFGLVKEFNKYLSFRTNIGSAWRAPNVNELYSFGKHQSVFEYGLWRYELFQENDSISTLSVLTNDQKEIKSERGLKWISTVAFSKNGLDIEITPHVNWIENYFFLRPYGITENVRGTFPYFIHDQTNAIYMGADLDIRKEWNPSTNSELKISYVNAKDQKNNQRFVGIPPLNVQLNLTKYIGNYSLSLSPEFEARQNLTPPIVDPSKFDTLGELSFERSLIFDFLTSPKAFFLMNASIKYEKEKLSIMLQGSNLFDIKYRRYTDNIRYFSDDLGINIGLFASYQF